MDPARDQGASAANRPTIVFDYLEGVMDEFKFRLMHPIGSYFNGRHPVYMAAAFHRSGPLYLGLTAENMFVAVKRFQWLVIDERDFNELTRLAEVNRAVMGNGNVLRIERPFFFNGHYHVVFPYMRMGTMRYIMKTKFPDGMPEDCILVILKEALKGLSSIHREGVAHTRFNSGIILLNLKPEIKIAFSATVYTPTEEEEIPPHPSFLPDSAIHTWAAAPEIYHTGIFQCPPLSDIWMVGITALELACGGITVADRRHLDLVAKKINKERRLPRPADEINVQNKYAACLGSPENHRVSFSVKGNFSERFEEMVARCLEKPAGARPRAQQLLEMDIFRELQMTVVEFYNLVRDRPVVEGF